jgi:hypothetical protein
MSITKSLRDLSRQEASAEDMAEFEKQVELETNDRGAAILMATNVELALSLAIFRLLDWDDTSRERLESDAGPISSFSKRILLGRALGIYGDTMQYNLDMVRQIRNAYAHSHVPITFETKEVKDAVGLLKQIELLPPFRVTGDKKLTTARQVFSDACVTLTHNLMIWAHSIGRKLDVPSHLIPPNHRLLLRPDPIL